MSIIEKLLDLRSFVSIGELIKGANCACGYGTIDNKLVYVYEQTGDVTTAQGKQIADMYKRAVKVGAPVVGVLNAKGMKLEEGLNAFDGYGQIFAAKTAAKGVVLQISLVANECMGLSAVVASMSDFVVTSGKDAKLFLQSPNVLSNTLKSQNAAQLAHITAEDLEASVAKVKELLTYLPSNNLDVAISACNDDLNREDSALKGEKDAVNVVKSICDNNAFVELQAGFCTNALTAFGKLNGVTVAIVGNSGALDCASIEKISLFVKFANKFGLPILTLTKGGGFATDANWDHKTAFALGKLIGKLQKAKVAKINVIIGDTYGANYLATNSKHIGADVVYAWIGTEIATLEKDAAKKVLNVKTAWDANSCAEVGFVDDIIEPCATRKRVIAALEMLSGKRI